jgi:hypothetical protein
MQCPKCGSNQPKGAAECGDCGIVFAKWTAAANVRRDPAPNALATPLERMLGGAEVLKVEQHARDLAEILVDWEIAIDYDFFENNKGRR